MPAQHAPKWDKQKNSEYHFIHSYFKHFLLIYVTHSQRGPSRVKFCELLFACDAGLKHKLIEDSNPEAFL